MPKRNAQLSPGREAARPAADLSCPLCRATGATLFHADRRREYHRCPRCKLVFVPPHYWLSAEEERARYDLHQNDPADRGYRGFLGQLLAPMVERLPPGAQGIDFGCGPGPTLSRMFQEAGFACADYDPFYANDPALLQRRYDFLACSEVLEHCHDPRREFELFLRLVKPGGIVGIMTQLVIDREAFARWRYIDDETHICFFSRSTFEWLSGAFGLPAKFFGKSVTLLFP